MKLGIISDAHGNQLGLKKCIDLLKNKGAERLIFLGDAIGYFPNPNDTLELLRAEKVECLLGNHEAMLTGQVEIDLQRDKVYGIEKARKSIDKNYISEISSWLPRKTIKIGSRKILCVHGSPWNPVNGYVYPDFDISRFSSLRYDIIFMGHTHIPFIHKIDTLTIVNVGSSGLPRDQGNLLSCVLYDVTAARTEILRIPFGTTQMEKDYSNNVHPSVLKCLKRLSNGKIFGKIVNED